MPLGRVTDWSQCSRPDETRPAAVLCDRFRGDRCSVLPGAGIHPTIGELSAPRINGHGRASFIARENDARQPLHLGSSHGHASITADVNGKANQVDLPAIEDAVRTILRAVGEDPNRPGLLETPRRVARMYKETFAGVVCKEYSEAT